MADTEIAIRIPPEAWTNSGYDEDPRGRLLFGGLSINGVPMHVEAYAVTDLYDEDDQHVPQAADGERFSQGVQHLQDAADCEFATTLIDGRAYAIVATPHER